jgi:hypothetical protein
MARRIFEMYQYRQALVRMRQGDSDMQALPAIAPDLGTWHRVTLHPDCHVKFDDSLYSAPFALVGKVLWLSAQAKEVGVACTQLIDRLLSDKVVERLRCPRCNQSGRDLWTSKAGHLLASVLWLPCLRGISYPFAYRIAR